MRIADIIELASAQVGYTEKKSKSSNLDAFPGDGALNNYTKYARDLRNAGYYNGNCRPY